jgi:hypothetical protein
MPRLAKRPKKKQVFGGLGDSYDDPEKALQHGRDNEVKGGGFRVLLLHQVYLVTHAMRYN